MTRSISYDILAKSGEDTHSAESVDGLSSNGVASPATHVSGQSGRAEVLRSDQSLVRADCLGGNGGRAAR